VLGRQSGLPVPSSNRRICIRIRRGPFSTASTACGVQSGENQQGSDADYPVRIQGVYRPGKSLSYESARGIGGDTMFGGGPLASHASTGHPGDGLQRPQGTSIDSEWIIGQAIAKCSSVSSHRSIAVTLERVEREVPPYPGSRKQNRRWTQSVASDIDGSGNSRARAGLGGRTKRRRVWE
jgi:hypothetical protein